ncbi:Ig-like domain-containing protein [[Clostridium] polysaccharolyticum]|uniref:Ig-like domain (Group 2) n=1 Tax=[Clostridium] polysaccharolyticum TaxID=29364 RepID=A0A1H9ZE38_9FIRM|nr:Ig-like domain-containing protein [[Clostridium] polysaccharolyticum]SES79853.1 Ig-like domain (group 2) [[Clostridium] polysaccharolyticum]
MLKQKLFWKTVRKRLLAGLLTITLSVPAHSASLFAAGIHVADSKQAHYNPAIVKELQKLCTNGENATDILDELRRQGIVDETGAPIENGTFQVDGRKMTAEELAKEARKQKTGKVCIDGNEVTWEEINRLLTLKESLKQLQDFMGEDVEIDESNRDAYLASAMSLRKQLAEGNVLVYDDPTGSTYGAGISHQARVRIKPDKTTLSETGNAQTIDVTVSLMTKQSVPVSLHYQTVSGSALAEGSGTVTIPAGETAAVFHVTYCGSNAKRKGDRVFYIECNEVTNALIDTGASYGKNITIPVTVQKNDEFVYEHNVAGKVEVSPWRTEKTHTEKKWYDIFSWFEEEITEYTYHKNMICTLTYQDIKHYIDAWPDNYYRFTYQENPSYDAGVSSSGPGSRTDELGRVVLPTDSVWQYKTYAVRKDHDFNYTGGISSNMYIKEIHERINLTKLMIPSGTFYAGQSVPITATFDECMQIDNSIKLKMTDGTVLTPVETGTKGNSCTFLYQVPEIPSGNIPNIVELSFHGTKSFCGDTLVIPGQARSNTAFNLELLSSNAPETIMISNKKCYLRYYKDASFSNFQCSIDDAIPGSQWVTEAVSVNQGGNGTYRKWIQSNCEPIDKLDLSTRKDLKNGRKVQEALKGTPYAVYADETKYSISEYVKSMYLSVDGGITRIPLYVVAQYGSTTETNEIPVALIAHYKPVLNAGTEPRKDAAELFMDSDIGSTYDYIKQEKEAELMFSQTSRGVVVPQFYDVKNAVFAYPGAAAIDYHNENPFFSSWESLVDDPDQLVSYHIDYDGNLEHMETSGRENPAYVNSAEQVSVYDSIDRKDKEGKDSLLTLKKESAENAAITTKQYDMKNSFITKPFRMQTDELGFVARFQSDKDFSFYGTKNLIWVSSDESVANVRYPEQFRGEKAATYGADHTAPVEIIPTGKVGNVYFTLYALNDGFEGYTPVEVCRSVTLFCEPGKEPYLRIPSSNGKTASLSCNQKESLDVCFISNLTAQNAEEAEKLSSLGTYQLTDYPTEFTMEVYETDFAGQPVGEPVYKDTQISTNSRTIGKMTIPEGILTRVSSNTEAVYTVKISAESLRAYGTDNGAVTKKELMTAQANITVYPNPPSLHLGKLDSYSILDNEELPITYQLESNGAALTATSLTITDSDGNTVLSEVLKPGSNTVTWTPGKVEGQLKKTYIVKASIQPRKGDTPTIDSYIVYVYNHEALDILIQAADGKRTAGKTDADQVIFDNHDKVKSLISADGKTIKLNGNKISLKELSKDINLASMISINYGDYVWGQISDQIKWDAVTAAKNTKDKQSTATTLNYEQGGAYSDIHSYNYVSYSPSESFMAVGLQDGKTVITATHARTGMKSSITVTSNTLKNQFYLFKFLPEQKTKLEYINGKGKACVMYSDANGELALYEESGIASDIHLFSENASESYIGTIVRKDILSGEQDFSKLQYYPVNNIMLRSLSNVSIYVTDEKGAPYANKQLWIRGGVYKNEEYCYAANLGRKKDHLGDGKQDQVFTTDETGKITVYFDATQFFTRSEETIAERTLQPDDYILYNLEVKFQPNDQVDKVKNAYEPQMVHVSSELNPYNVLNDCSAYVKARPVRTGVNTPVINRQLLCQCEESGAIADVTDIYGYKGAIGLSKQYPCAIVETESLMWGETVKTEPYIYKDRDGTEISYGDAASEINKNGYKLNYADSYGAEFENQKNKVITYPFADMPVVESTWTMNKESINKVIPQNKVIPLFVEIYRDKNVIKEFRNDFRCTTKTNEDPINEEVKDDLQELLDSVSSKLDWTGPLKDQISKDKLFSYAGDGLGSLLSLTGLPIKAKLSPTKDPRCFHVMITMGGSLASSSDSSETYYDKDGNTSRTTYQVNEKTPFSSSSDTTDISYDKDGNTISETHKGKKTTLFSKDDSGKKVEGGQCEVAHQDNTETKGIFKKLWNKGKDKVAKEVAGYKKKKEVADAQKRYEKKVGSANITYGGSIYYEFRYGDNGQWEAIFYGGGLNAGFGVNFGFTKNFMVGPVPVTCSLNLGISASMGFDCTITGEFEGIENKNNYLTTAQVKMMCEAFAGVGWDCGFVALKLGITGSLTGSYTLKNLDAWNVNYKEKMLNKVDMLGTNATVEGELGLKFSVRVLFFSYDKKLWSASHKFVDVSEGDYDDIGTWWKESIEGVHSESLDVPAQLCSIDGVSQESRAYLAFEDRKWTGGSNEEPAEGENYSLTMLQSNAYTYAEPIYNDDGSMIAYLSDSDSSDVEDTLASYAVKKNGSYVNQHGIDPVTYTTDDLNNETGARGSDGKLDPIYDKDGKVLNPYRTTERTGYGDSTLRIAGTKEFSAAAWVRQKNPLPDADKANPSYEDLAVMLNQSEICASIWNGDKWITCKLTDNSIGDLSPAVAVNGNYAVVAWRTCSGSDASNPTDFNVRDEIHAKVYNKQNHTWGETITLYNGQTGSVHGLEAAVMSDGTVMAAYVIKTGSDSNVMTDTEIMYTTVDAKGNAGESIRVTNDNNIDQNLQLSKVNWNGEEHFILGWFNERASTQLDGEGNAVPVRDIKLLAINSCGMPNSDFIESIHYAGAEVNSANFRFSKPAGDATLDDLSIVWLNMCKEQSEDKEESELAPKNTYVLSAIHFATSKNTIILSAPVEVARMQTGETIDEFSSYGNRNTIQTVLQSTDYNIDPSEPKTYDVTKIPVLDETDGKEKTQNIYTPVGKTNMYTVTSKYKQCAVETEGVYVDRSNVIMGFSTPVGFTVKNTGIRTIDKITLTLDGNTTEFNTELLPGESQTISEYYKVPADTVKDVTYAITAHSGNAASKADDCSGVIKLNLPDVGVSDVQIAKEEEQERIIQVTLNNQSQVPFKNGGKEIVVGLYDKNPETSSEELKPIDKITIKDNDELALVDASVYNCQFKLSKEKMGQLIEKHYTEEELRKSRHEIPHKELVLYTKAWIVDKTGEVQEEEYTGDNEGRVSIESLLDKYQCEYSIDSHVERTEDNAVDAVITIKNNSYARKMNGNAIAVLCNSKGKVISKEKQTYKPAKEDKGIVCVKEEESKDITIRFTADDLLDGYKLEDAISIRASFGCVDLGDQSAQLEQFGVKGQEVACSLFDVDGNHRKPSVWNQDKKIYVDGELVKKRVEVHTNYYQIAKKLNDRQRKTFVSAVSKNPGDELRITVNGTTIAKGTGAQIIDANLSYNSNDVQATVESSPIKQMDVVRKVVTTDKKGKPQTKQVKERYMLNQDGNPVDAQGEELDLTAGDVVSYEEVYVVNQSVYKAKLSLANSDEAVVDKEEVPGNQVLLLKSKMLVNKKGIANTCKLTWNAIQKADGYLVYGAKCNTHDKSYAFKRLAKVKGNKKLTFTQKSLKTNRGYKYLVKAYKMVNGKQKILARSYVVRTFALDKNSKYGNPVNIKTNKTHITTRKGKSVKLKSIVVLPKRKKKKKLGTDIRYISSDITIATVTSSGKVTGRKKGTCYVYVVAQNGVWKKIKVTVK